MATKTAKPTIESLTKQITGLGLKVDELPANATTQSRRFYDPKENCTFITFTNGHVARTLEGKNGKRVSINHTKEGELQLLKTEPARLNRILQYLAGREN